ncbi:uncharacterized protein CDAR_523331 [Caerostris darwini]|uniref:Uncharacterized protein n=1 Tax=Caerostris darwini TaxID=1538125 RepID=A0AAV4X1E2_9ARAC|nr:uncharacterized protein CDAR_523331 [Caerostris darwini]
MEYEGQAAKFEGTFFLCNIKTRIFRIKYWKTTYVRGGHDLPYVACFSRNLQIFSQDEPETQKLYGEKTSKIQYFSLPNREDEAFYPWMVSHIFLSIHSSVIPENPLTMGKALRLGYQYKVSFRLEEEHLLPLPYATNCTDYDAMETKRQNRTPVPTGGIL